MPRGEHNEVHDGDES